MTVDSQMILIPGNLIVGANLAAEYIRVTNTIASAGEGNVVLTLNPVAKFSEIPAVWGLPQSTRTITTWHISNQSETEIKITVTVGSGTDGDTVTMAAVLIGPQA